jgi:hypothetical protein
LGVGTITCGKWTASKNNLRNRAAYGSWVSGYLTAYNDFSFSGPHDITRNVDYEGVMAWIDNYCTQNALKTLRSATDALLIELLKK